MDDVGKLVQAIDIIHSPTVSQQQRLSAQQFCEQIKVSTNPVQLVHYGASLASQSNASPVRHFGFHLIEYIIKEQWNSLSHEQKEEIKKNLLSVVANGTKDLLIEEKYIKEKVVRLVVECALREFPQRWPSLLPSLFDIATMGEKQKEIVVMILRTLPEDIKTFIHENLSNQRRRDLLNGLTQQLKIIFDFIYKCLDFHYGAYVRISNSGNSTSNDAKIHLKLVDGLLATLSSYIEWAPLNFITERNFPEVLCQLITQGDVRMLACENIVLLLSRKGGKSEERLTFIFNYLGVITTALSNRSNSLENDYLFHKQLASILQLTGMNHLATVGNTPLPPSYPNFLSLMLEFLNHPSTYISLHILPFWVVLLSHKSIVTQPFFGEYYGKLLKLAENKMFHFDPFLPANDKLPASYFAKQDFDTRAEYFNILGNVKHKSLELVKAITHLKPELVLEYASVRTHELLSQISAQGVNADKIKQLDAIEFFILSAVQGIEALQKDYSANIANALNSNGSLMQNPPSPFYLEGQTQLIFLLESIIKQILEFESKDTAVVGFLVSTLEKFTVYFSVKHEAIPFVLQKIFTIIQFRKDSEANTDLTDSRVYMLLSSETIATRRKGCYALIHICSNCPKSVSHYMPKLLELSQSLFTSTHILDAERCCILESLVAVSSGMEKPAQLEFILNIVSPIETDWCSTQISECIASPQAVVNNIGVNRNSTSSIAIVSPTAKKAQYYVHTLASLWKRANSSHPPVQIPVEHILKMLPNIFNLIHSLHALWSPEIRSQLIAPQFYSIFNIDQVTATAILGLHTEQVSENKQLNEAEMHTKIVRSWLEGMRDYGYALLGSFTHTENFFSIDQLPSAIANYVFGNYVDFIEYRHLKILLRQIIFPMSTECPISKYNSFLLPILPPFMNLLVTRLSAGWKKMQASAEDSLAKIFANSEADEVLEDKLLRDLTREFLQWLPKLLSLNPSTHINPAESSMEGPTAVDNSPRTIHVLGIESLIIPMLHGMIGCLSWPDSVSFTKCINFCAVIVPWIAKTGNVKYLAIINDMLVVCLKIMISPHLLDYRGEFVTLVHSIYMNLSKISTIPQTVLMSLPRVTSDTIQTLNQVLCDTTDEKKQKQTIRTFLQAYCEVPIEKKKISDLPEKMARTKPQASSWHDVTSAEDLGLSSLL